MKKTYVLVQQGGDLLFALSLMFDALADARSWPFFETDFPLDAQWEAPTPEFPHWVLQHHDADTSFTIYERFMDEVERRHW